MYDSAIRSSGSRTQEHLFTLRLSWRNQHERLEEMPWRQESGGEGHCGEVEWALLQPTVLLVGMVVRVSYNKSPIL